MKQKNKMLSIAIASALLLSNTVVSAEYDAKEKLELLTLGNTSLYLIKQLVNQGVLTREQAINLITASEKAATEDAKRLRRINKTKNKQAKTQEKGQLRNKFIKILDQDSTVDVHKIEPGTIRVPLIPEIVKQEIREQVSTDLRESVSSDILAKAKQERWGIPGVLPTWVDRIKISGDIRLRAQSDIFDRSNTNPLESGLGYFNYQKINSAGGISNAGDEVYLNSYENRERMRIRARLAISAKITHGWKTALRFTTGNFTDPVSTNQTLGNSNRNARLVLERAYLQFESEFGDMIWTGGRVKNPWLSTNLVWDKDLNFDGMAFQFHLNKSENPLDMDEENVIDPFLTIAAFPLAEENRYTDKWLLGAQIGFNYTFLNSSQLSFGLAYYDYQNIEAKNNPFGSTINNHTIPDYVQQGNSMFNINQTGGEKYGLATDYNLLNLTLKYDMANYAPIHVYLTADYVENIGYRITEDAKLSDPSTVGADGYKKQNKGYQVRIDVGWPDYTVRGNWRTFFAYKKLERDAVLDAFTDSDFHLGGTDAEGYILGLNYGIDDNVWVTAKFFSTDVVNGLQYGPGGKYKINTFQFDLNTKF